MFGVCAPPPVNSFVSLDDHHMPSVGTCECAHCGREVSIPNTYFPLCEACLDAFERSGWIQRLPLQAYRLTPSGALKFPCLEIVAKCANDGMGIFRRWVELGLAKLDPRPLCPFCLGVDAEIRKPRVVRFSGS